MHLLGNFIRDKFLEDILILYHKYRIEENFSPRGALSTRLVWDNNFVYDFFDTYVNNFKRQFAILKILAIKQNLDTNRQVFNLVRNHITRSNTKLTLSHLVNLHYSHISRTIVSTLEEMGIKVTNPK